MSYTSPSDEVAEDFANALEALNINNRYEISNLTVIAKEHTEYAFAISEALKTHIRQTAPGKKLPAFYVLDSIVKNVGTPYTLFFGRQLYATFMEAYALMDTPTRRKMDEMLKTWKEPVPGAMDTRPVFPPEITRPIENALIKARTSFLEAQQQLQRNQPQIGRGRPMPTAPLYRETATPPGVMQQQMSGPPGYQSYTQPGYPPAQSYASPQPYATPQTYQNPQPYQPPPQQYQQPQHYATSQPYQNHMNGQQSQPEPYNLPQRPPTLQYSQQTQNSSAWQQPYSQTYQAPDNSVDTLNSDIADLISLSKTDFARNPEDKNIQTRLKALLDLNTILSSQRLPPDQISAIKDQVAQLSIAARQPKFQEPHVPVPPPAPQVVAQPPAQQPSLNSLLGPGALAALLARQSQTSTPQPIPQSHPVVAIKSPPRATTSAVHSSTPVPDPKSLLEQLRAAGLLKGATAATSAPPTHLSSLGGQPPSGFPPSVQSMNTPPNSRTPLAEIPNDVELKPASLKLPRPHLIFQLYEKLGQPCNQCGRRFLPDDEGKKKKAAHMDWHFKVNSRMADVEKRGQHRTWYLDELDWIKSRETEEEHNQTGDVTNGSGSTSSGPSKPKVQYIPEPDDAPPGSNVCRICMDEFKKDYIDEQWVWLDAMKVGDRYYHASCYAEATKDAASSRINRATPEPVLGKRKAEDELMALRSKIKTEPAA